MLLFYTLMFIKYYHCKSKVKNYPKWNSEHGSVHIICHQHGKSYTLQRLNKNRVRLVHKEADNGFYMFLMRRISIYTGPNRYFYDRCIYYKWLMTVSFKKLFLARDDIDIVRSTPNASSYRTNDNGQYTKSIFVAL